MRVIGQDDIDATGLKLGIVVSMFNDQITKKMLEGALTTAREMGIAEDDILVCWVAGAFELPLVAQELAEDQGVDAVAAIGCVIRGETPHFDFVAGETARGLMQVTLESGIPVALGVTTTDTLAQAEARAGGTVGNKGSEAVYAVLHSAAVLRELAKIE
ncbi:MAG: 6,7-dimethyl-8-ribityllumazine synthase [Dehalococcoidia bacterium]